MCAKPVKSDFRGRPDPRDTVGTTGHVWDGIEELNTPLPRWWVWVFYLTIIFAIGYGIAYPAWPLIRGATPGVLGYTTRAEFQTDMDTADARTAPIRAKLVAADLMAIDTDPELKQFAVSAGAAVFRTNCAQCHGSGAAGVKGKGYPNLLDNDWLWGGSLDAIHTTLLHGIRSASDPDTHLNDMPRFGTDELLTKAQIAQSVEYVLQISGQDHDAALAATGQAVFAENCVACHGDLGKGNRDLGAPNLTDAIWLYGGDRDTLTVTVTQARNGVMPAWGYVAAGTAPRLTEDQIRAVAVYVHALGGGE